MWFVSNPPCRQTLVGSGMPGKGVDVQSAKAHWLLGISSRGSRWWTRRVSVAPVLLVLTASYAGGSVMSWVLAGLPRMYSERTRPVIADPSGFLATGRLMRKPVVRSP